MLKQDKKWGNEKGMALIVALLVTSALVVVGSFSMMMTNTELDISKNDRFSKESFFFTDSGGPICTSVIKSFFWNRDIDTTYYSNNNIVVGDSNLKNEIYNEQRNSDKTIDTALNNKHSDNPSNNPDITYSQGGRGNLNIDIDWRHKEATRGHSLVTHAGYEGSGVARSATIFLEIDCQGRVGKQTARIMANYKKQKN